eukprot:g8524.t1
MTGNGSAERRLYVANGTTFMIPKRYNHLEVIGKGSYGMVCSAVDSVRNNAAVAIKKITPMAAHSVDARHVLREVRIMRYLGEHENVVTLEDLFCDEEQDELYVVMELLDSDLHRIVQSNQVLSRKHHQVFMIQILRGVEFLHKNGIIHRDLKPGNILLTRTCQLRISDFGLARELPKGTGDTTEARRDGDGMTEHVVTRWYRPPELMLSPNGFYGFPVDVWSVGCIFGEILGRRPLFPGSSFVDQLSLIFDVLGAPAPDEVAHIKGAQARKFLDKLTGREGVPFSDLIPGTQGDAAALLESLLQFDPLKRCTPGEALGHPFFHDLGEETTLDVAPPTGLEFDFEQKGVPRSRLKELIAAEIDHFQAGGANLTLHPKKQRHRRQHHAAAPRTIGHAENGELPVKAMAAAAAASSAPFSSDNDDDVSEEENDEDGHGQGDGRSNNPESDRCYSSSDSLEEREEVVATEVPQESRSPPLPVDYAGATAAAPDDIGVDDDVACLDAASLQSLRLCPKEDATEDESDEATTDDDGGEEEEEEYDSEGSRADLMAVVVSATGDEGGEGDEGDDDDDDDTDDGTVSSLSRSSSPSTSSTLENNGRVEDEHAALAKRSGGAAYGPERRTYWESTQANKNEAEGGGRARGRREGTAMPATSPTDEANAKSARRSAAVGAACCLPVHAKGSTQNRVDFSPIPEEEGQDSPTPRAGRDHGSGVGGEAASAGEGKSSVACPQFDSFAELSPGEASESSRSFATSTVSVPAKPTRAASVAGFVRGSDGWDSESDGASGDHMTNVGRRLFVGLMSPSPPQRSSTLLAPEASKAGNGGESQSSEIVQREDILACGSVLSGSGSGRNKSGPSSSQASALLRRERAERAWQVVGDARAQVKARADAAAATSTGPAEAKAGLRARHPAAVAAKRRTAAVAASAPARERRAKLMHDVRQSGGRKGVTAAKAESIPFPPPAGGKVKSTRRAPASGSTLLLENEDSSWLRPVVSDSTVKPATSGGAKVSGNNDRVPLGFRRSPLEKNADPFSYFLSGKTSLVTQEDPFCDYVSGKTTISAGSVADTAAPAAAHAAAPTSATPPAPTVPTDGGARLPVLKVGQRLKVRGASLLMNTPDKSQSQEPFFRGDGRAEKDACHRQQPRAPVASVEREHVNPFVMPARRSEYPVAGGGAASVASSRGSPPPVPPPLGQRRRHGSRRAREGARGRSLIRGYRALPKPAAADGGAPERAARAAADAGAGAGRGRQRTGLPPLSPAVRVKAKGGRGYAAVHRGDLSAAAAAEDPRASATPGEESTTSASRDTYYSINDVVMLKLPDRFSASSSAGNTSSTSTSGQERGGVDGPLSPIPHNRLTAKPHVEPRSIPPVQTWKWTSGQTTRTAPPAAAAAGARHEVEAESEQGRPAITKASTTTTAALPRQQPRSPISRKSSPATRAEQRAVPAAGDGDGGGSPTTITTTTSAAAGKEGQPTTAGESMSLASAVYAVKLERGAARTNKEGPHHPRLQLDKPRGYPVGAPVGAGRAYPPTRAAPSYFENQAGHDKDGHDDAFDEEEPAASAEQKFTLLQRLWKRSNAAFSTGKQGAISATTRHAPRAASFDAEPSPRSPVREEEGSDHEDAAPGPVLISQMAAAFPMPQKIAGKVLPSSPQHQQRLKRHQRRGPPVTAAAAILSADKSHKRTASGATSLTCGTSPASSATSGFRGEGSQQLLVPHAAGSGLSPTRRGRGSVAGSCSVRGGSHPAAAATAAESSARLRTGGRRRRDNIIRAVQFAGEMPGLPADLSASAQNRGGDDAGASWRAGVAGCPGELKHRPFQPSGMVGAGGGQRCGIRDNICRGGNGGGGVDGSRQQNVCPAPPSPGGAAAKPPRHSSTVYP